MSGPPKNFASLLRARRGYLATIGPDGGPHIVPVCFTWAGDVIWTAVDGKPKKGGELQRLTNLEANSKVCLTVDRWDEDWSRLAWLQARGSATVLRAGGESDRAATALRSKYAQYEDVPISGPVIRIEVENWIGWSAESD